jgi:hypothetical protein
MLPASVEAERAVRPEHFADPGMIFKRSLGALQTASLPMA